MCSENPGCCIDLTGQTSHTMVRCMSNGLHYKQCRRCGKLEEGELDTSVLSGMGCCVENGEINHKFPRVSHRGVKYQKRYCSRCDAAKYLFRCVATCIVCQIGDDSPLGLKCCELGRCNGTFLTGGRKKGKVKQIVSKLYFRGRSYWGVGYWGCWRVWSCGE